MQKIAKALVIGIFVTAIGFVFMQSSTPSIASDGAQVVDTAAAVVGGDVGTVSRAEVDTRCVAGGDGWSNLCLSSDNSGSLTITNGDVAREFRYAFYADAGNCPAAPEGFSIQLRDWATADWLDWGFTTDDIVALGLDGLYCAYSG